MATYYEITSVEQYFLARAHSRSRLMFMQRFPEPTFGACHVTQNENSLDFSKMGKEVFKAQALDIPTRKRVVSTLRFFGGFQTVIKIEASKERLAFNKLTASQSSDQTLNIDKVIHVFLGLSKHKVKVKMS